MKTVNILFTPFLFLSGIVVISCSNNNKITFNQVEEYETRNLMNFVNSTEYPLGSNSIYIIKPPNSCSSCLNSIYRKIQKDSNEHYVIFLPKGDSLFASYGIEKYYYSVDLFDKSGLSRNYPLSFTLTGELSIQPLIGD
jgi:hypothetical protein